MEISRVLLVCHPARQNAAQTAQQLADFLRSKDIRCEILNDYRHIPKYPLADLCVSLGGDGTALRCARATAPLQMPLLAVNCGSLGFLSACEEAEAQHCLQQILDGNCQITRRLLLSADIIRAGQKPVTNLLAFNDCVIKTLQPRAFPLRVQYNGTELKNYYGDGLIVSTPAGSTAYSLAAGGPIVEPEAENIIVTPICAHIMAAKSFVLSPGRTVTVLPERLHGKRVVLSVDGSEGLAISPGDEVRLSRSENRVIMADMEVRSFYDTAMGKLTRP